MDVIQKARGLLRRFKGSDYLLGRNVLSQAGPLADRLRHLAMIVMGTVPGSVESVAIFRRSLVDDYMGPILEAAKTGDLGLIRNL